MSSKAPVAPQAPTKPRHHGRNGRAGRGGGGGGGGGGEKGGKGKSSGNGNYNHKSSHTGGGGGGGSSRIPASNKGSSGIPSSSSKFRTTSYTALKTPRGSTAASKGYGGGVGGGGGRTSGGLISAYKKRVDKGSSVSIPPVPLHPSPLRAGLGVVLASGAAWLVLSGTERDAAVRMGLGFVSAFFAWAALVAGLILKLNASRSNKAISAPLLHGGGASGTPRPSPPRGAVTPRGGGGGGGVRDMSGSLDRGLNGGAGGSSVGLPAGLGISMIGDESGGLNGVGGPGAGSMRRESRPTSPTDELLYGASTQLSEAAAAAAGVGAKSGGIVRGRRGGLCGVPLMTLADFEDRLFALTAVWGVLIAMRIPWLTPGPTGWELGIHAAGAGLMTAEFLSRAHRFSALSYDVFSLFSTIGLALLVTPTVWPTAAADDGVNPLQVAGALVAGFLTYLVIRTAHIYFWSWRLRRPKMRHVSFA